MHPGSLESPFEHDSDVGVSHCWHGQRPVFAGKAPPAPGVAQVAQVAQDQEQEQEQSDASDYQTHGECHVWLLYCTCQIELCRNRKQVLKQAKKYWLIETTLPQNC